MTDNQPGKGRFAVYNINYEPVRLILITEYKSQAENHAFNYSNMGRVMERKNHKLVIDLDTGIPL